MARSPRLLLVCAALSLCLCGRGGDGDRPIRRQRDAAPAPEEPAVALHAVGPRFVSNQTRQPLQLYGSGLADGMTLHLGPPVNRDLPVRATDPGHAFTVLPADVDLPRESEAITVDVELRAEGGLAVPGRQRLRLVNDRAFVDLETMVARRDGAKLFAASPTTDELFAIDPVSGQVTRSATGDGPRALATWVDAEGKEQIAIVHENAPELRLVPAEDPGATPRIVPAPRGASGLAIGDGVAYVAESVGDTVVAIDLATGREKWRTEVGPNPRALAIAGDRLAVGIFLTGEVEVLSRADGRLAATIAPGPGTPIVGGGTADFDDFIMGGTGPRALGFSARTGKVLLASIGPNIGPNPRRMEVSMNGGVAVLDAATGRYERHLGFGNGIPEALAVDDAAGLVYVADIGIGLVRVVDLRKLVQSDEAAAGALVQGVPIPPPEGFPTARPPEDYGVNRRAGVELHSGPRAVVLSGDRRTLWVLDRFTGTLATLDVARARQGQARFVRQVPIVDTLGQRERRLGQILYHADMGRSAMSCDACHPNGHSGGMLFEKTHPLRIYRSTSILGSAESAPYFTPASNQTLEDTNRMVGGRNRYHNPAPTDDEVALLTLFTECIPTPPNPHVDEDGVPRESLTMPDGRTGNARRGIGVFAEAGCQDCHPPPHFTLDQDEGTRGQYQSVGTPLLMPLRPTQQERGEGRFAPPSLLGGWDVFPMFNTGTAGLTPTPEGTLRRTTRFPLRAALSLAKRHGRTRSLTPEQTDDLLAYLLSL